MIPSPEVVSCSLGTGAALLDLRTGTYFSVNDTGAAVWSLLGSGRSFAELLKAMHDRYQVDAAVLSADLREIVSELEAAGLITLSAVTSHVHETA